MPLLGGTIGYKAALEQIQPVACGSVRAMLALVAEFERERIRERLVDGRTAKRRDGGHIGGSAPFGFRKIGAGRAARLEPDPAQQAALADMRKLAAEGVASRAIAVAVQERHGITVSHVTVRAALARDGGLT
jgi:DNA invertase Pin-like site-specific DNA recombinase